MMPLWKLQRVGDEVLDFLYPNTGKGRSITLRPGVAYCLRSFYGILRNLIEGAWLNYVRMLNVEVMGQTVDLSTFLFGSERSSLELFRPLLRDLQNDTCFYCHRALKDKGEVDHFIPWSRYPVDLGHNFVLAHRTCNLSKCDHLAAEEHLGAWADRVTTHGPRLTASFTSLQVSNDLAQSVSIARWAYSQTEKANGLVWLRSDELRHLGHDWQHRMPTVS